MDVTALTAAFRTRLGVPATDAMFTDAVILELLNFSIQKINGDHDWAWLEKSESINTVNGTAVYSVGADWIRTLLIQFSDYTPLEKVTIDRIRMLGSPAGRPTFYSCFGDQLHVRPVPTGVTAMTHLYIKIEPDLAGPTDVPLMPKVYQPILVEYAAYLGFLRVGDLQEAGSALARYERWLQRQIDPDAESRYSADLGGGATPAPKGKP